MTALTGPATPPTPRKDPPMTTGSWIDERHGADDPTARSAPHTQRLAALTRGLATVATAVADTPADDPHPDGWLLRHGLTDLAATALAWLDAHTPGATTGDGYGTDDGYEADDGYGASPF